jgi:hypothetical protein
VYVTVTQDKWEKGKVLIQSLWQHIEAVGLSHEGADVSSLLMDDKESEIARRFLIHLSMTFETLTRHLKGFHLMLAANLPRRNDDGWKLSDAEWMTYLLAKVDGQMTQEEADQCYAVTEPLKSSKPPTSIHLTKHLRDDLFELREMFDLDKPPEFQVRRQSVHLLLYGLADASGGGLGSTVTVLGSGTRCHVGVWGKDDENESSNFKEFENVVLTIEGEARHGLFQGSSMYLFTDNSTIEGALFKGNTPSRKLFILIVRFRKVQMATDAEIIVSHISGTRMIAQGADGVSRGLLTEGVTSGLDMLSFVPRHLTVIERDPK